MNMLVTAALAFFFAIGLGLAAAGGIRAAWRGLGRRRGVSAALAAFAVVATICAQKPGPSGPTITIDALLRDAGCYATNDVFHAAVSNAPAYAAIDFSACPVLVYARERGQTAAADWFELTPRRTFSALPADYAIANATNYNYMVYLDYVPPTPVHTNGVFELYGFVVPDDEPGNLERLSAGFINSRVVPLRMGATIEWTDGYRYISDGTRSGSAGKSVTDTYIPIVGGHAYTVFCGSGGTANRYAHVYRQDKSRIESVNETKANATFTFTANVSAAFLRYTCNTDSKATTYVHDDTDNKYIVQNGVIL